MTPPPLLQHRRVSYRRATTDDVPALRALPRAGEAGGDPRMLPYLTGEHHPRQALAPRVIWMAAVEATPIGYVAGHRTRRFDCDGELQWIYVSNASRRLGVGSRLLETMASWFVEQRARRVCVDVGDDAARPFYGRHGATELDRHWMVWPDIAAVLAMPTAAKAELARMYADDCREHAAVPPVGTSEYDALRDRDRTRRARAAHAVAALRATARLSAEDAYHAAWLFNHGDLPDEAREAHELAVQAAAEGAQRARWLAAAALDRWCMYDGRPQKYGTQLVPDGIRYRLWDVDPATTDAERAAWDVPTLAEQLRRAEELTRREPQPPLAHAPPWLAAALTRWKSS